MVVRAPYSGGPWRAWRNRCESPSAGRQQPSWTTALGLTTTGDLLRYYPRRYARRGELTDLASLRDGDQVTVFAQVERVSTRRMRARRGQLLEVTVTDGRARLALTFFNKVQYWERQLTPGRHAMFAGRVSTFKGKRQLAHPEFKLLGADDAAKAAEYAAELIPVYPATKDVSTWDIEKCVQIVLDTLGELDDPLPPPLRSGTAWPGSPMRCAASTGPPTRRRRAAPRSG